MSETSKTPKVPDSSQSPPSPTPLRSRTNNHYHTRIPNPNTALLHPGDQLTYKELVDILDEDFISPTNSSRKKQLKEFEQLFSYSKGPGRKFTIQKIYPPETIPPEGKASQEAKEDQIEQIDQVEQYKQVEAQNSPSAFSLLSPSPASPSVFAPVPALPDYILHPVYINSDDPDGSPVKGRKSSYYTPFVNILLRRLPALYETQTDSSFNSPMYVALNQLLEYFGFVNFKYSALDRNRSYTFDRTESRTETDILSSSYATRSEVDWFVRTTRSNFQNLIDNQLAIQVRLGTISLDHGYLLITPGREPYPAAEEEAEEIREAEAYALDEFQYSSLSEVVLHRKTREFYRTVHNNFPYDFPAAKYCKCYVIRIKSEGCKGKTEEIYEGMNEEEYSFWKKQMNEAVINSFKRSIDSYYKKYQKKHQKENKENKGNKGNGGKEEIDKETDEETHYYPSSFVEDEKELVEELLRIKE